MFSEHKSNNDNNDSYELTDIHISLIPKCDTYVKTRDLKNQSIE